MVLHEGEEKGQEAMNMESRPVEHIFLIGFMGAGKSFVGKALAKELGWAYLDTDERIRQEEGTEIGDLFEKFGESWFRERERQVLKNLEDEKKCLVISCGGGIGAQKENIPLLKKTGKVVFLEASPASLLARLQGDKSRPLLQDGNLEDKIRDLKNKRQKTYEEAMDFKIVTDDLSVEEIIERIRDFMAL